MKHNYVKLAFNKILLGAAILGSGFAINACSDDHVDDLNVQSATITSQANALAGKNGDIIPGKYIVVLKEEEAGKHINRRGPYKEVTQQARGLGQGILRENGIPDAAIEHAYGSSISGFSAALSERNMARLRADQRVAYIEPDRIITLEQKGKPGGGSSTPPPQITPWGIARVGGAVEYTGTAVAWIIDTGVDLTHPDLNTTDTRHTYFTSGRDSNPKDGNGHGTHVAGTIAAKNNSFGVVGVAAGAPVVSVRVLDSRGSGTIAGVVAGVDYVAANASTGDVANMSLGGGKSTTLNNAVIAASTKNGKQILFAVAAGNEGSDANNYSPASASTSIDDNIFTITAYAKNSTVPSWSNYGVLVSGVVKPVDYSCPGVEIQSTWKDGGYNTISGTSMAAPHMAGIILLIGKPSSVGLSSLENGAKKYGFIISHSLNIQ